MEHEQAIAEILRRYRGDPSNMTGPAAANDRQQMVKLLTGEKRPKSGCGVNHVVKLVMEALDAPGDSRASQCAYVREWCEARVSR